MADLLVASDATRVFPLELDRKYPVVVRGEGEERQGGSDLVAAQDQRAQSPAPGAARVV